MPSLFRSGNLRLRLTLWYAGVLTFRNVHNWAMAGTAPAMFKAFYAVLKPGGVLGVVDHRRPRP